MFILDKFLSINNRKYREISNINKCFLCIIIDKNISYKLNFIISYLDLILFTNLSLMSFMKKFNEFRINFIAFRMKCK